MVRTRAISKTSAGRRYRREYEWTLGGLQLWGHDYDLPLEFKVHEALRAFLRWKRLEAGIDARSRRREADAYELQTLAMLCKWVPGKDPDFDTFRRNLHEMCASENSAKIDAELERYWEAKEKRFFREQRHKAQQPRKKVFLSQYIKEVLKAEPDISAANLKRRIIKDADRDGHPADYIHAIEDDTIIAVDPETGERDEAKISGLPTRLSRIKKI